MQHARLKNKITRHESRMLRPKISGPTVPDENLYAKSNTIRQAGTTWIEVMDDIRKDIDVRCKPHEENFIKFRVGAFFDWYREYAYNNP